MYKATLGTLRCKARVQQLAHQAPALQPKKKASDFAVMVNLKTKELNDGKPKGSKLSLHEIQDIVRDDPECQKILSSKRTMEKYRELFNDHKADEALGKRARVSRKAGAQMGNKGLNLMHAESVHLNEMTGAVTFGATVRGSFESSVVSGFFGAGPIDEFLRETFGKGCTEFVNIMEAWVTKREKLGTRRISTVDMSKETVRMIGTRLQEVTGVVDLKISYADFDRRIVAPYRVNISGWPEDIERTSPQRLSVADDIRRLYTAWKDGTAHWYKMSLVEHKAFVKELEKTGGNLPKPRAKRSDAGGTHRGKNRRTEDSSEDEEVDEEEQRRPEKRSKKSANADGAARASTSKKTGGIKAGKGSSATAKKNTVKGSRAGPGRNSGGTAPSKVAAGSGKSGGSRASGSKGDGRGKKRAGKGGRKSRQFIVNSGEESDGDATPSGEEEEASQTEEE